MRDVIASERLELVALDRDYLAAPPGARPDRGFSDPHGFLDGAGDVVELRRAQLAAEPDTSPWLLRAMVVVAEGIAIGFVGFHAAPDVHGVAEIGYEVLPAYRRRGYAREAVIALLQWAASSGARRVRASVGPDNTASLALVASLGLVLVGEQIDDVDGRELVFEKDLTG